MEKQSTVFICDGGPLYKIFVGAKAYLFEMHPFCGPLPVHSKTFEGRNVPPKDRFWWAVTCWDRQGRQTGKECRNGAKICAWTPDKSLLFQRGPMPECKKGAVHEMRMRHDCCEEIEAIRGARPKIVCISGSSRFVDKMSVKAWEMEKKGILVLGLRLLPAWYEGVQPHHQAEAEGVREILDALHFRKIDLADELFVFNEGGYVGSSTKDEIIYATKKGKPVKFLEEPRKS